MSNSQRDTRTTGPRPPSARRESLQVCAVAGRARARMPADVRGVLPGPGTAARASERLPVSFGEFPQGQRRKL